MTKKEIRKTYLEKRRLLSEQAYLQSSYQLCEMFFASIDLSFVKVLHVFIPIEKNKEPNTWLIIDRLRREYPQIRLSIPRVNSETGNMDNFFFEGIHQLQQNLWGILEPKQGVPTPTGKIDLVLVPMLAFDKRGHRVGYGRGYYDKFLSTCSDKCKSVGLSLFDPIEQIDDITEYDFPLQYALTPNGAHHFS
jgi:5-formyltetrahydrofolate cyclo-ligase